MKITKNYSVSCTKNRKGDYFNIKSITEAIDYFIASVIDLMKCQKNYFS